MTEPAEWIDVAAEGEIPPGGFCTVDWGRTTIAVVNVDGAYYAIEDLCTHEEEVLTHGDIEGDQIVCCRHGARFCLKTGAALTPPAYEPVQTFPVRVRDGRVEVGVPE
jgi:3-phenylpropionate/trans-cinnamate dioxygenase ferredoxin subunit